jgi:large subunit ribosomal protein L12
MQNIYAALLLHKLGKTIDEAGMKNILQAAGASVDESAIKTMIASLKGVDIDKALAEAKVTPTAAAAPVAEKKEEKKEEKHEMAAEGLASLFG